MTDTANPFVATCEVLGRTRTFTDVAAVAAALAEKWPDAQLGATEAGQYGFGKVLIGDLVISIREGKKIGQVAVRAGAPALSVAVGSPYGLEWPSATADTAKGMERLTKDLRRRVVDPAAEPLAKLRQRLAAAEADRAALEKAAALLRARFPAACITVPSDISGSDATFSLSAGETYIRGRFTASGGLRLEYVSTLPADRAARAIAAMLG